MRGRANVRCLVNVGALVFLMFCFSHARANYMMPQHVVTSMFWLPATLLAVEVFVGVLGLRRFGFRAFRLVLALVMVNVVSFSMIVMPLVVLLGESQFFEVFGGSIALFSVESLVVAAEALAFFGLSKILWLRPVRDRPLRFRQAVGISAFANVASIVLGTIVSSILLIPGLWV